MGNSLTIISRKEKEELYKDLEGKWLIELDGNKIENIDDFAVAIMDEIDIVYDYKNLYGYDWYSFRDAATELEMIREKKFKGGKTDVIIVYDSPRLDMDEIDRGFIYQHLISLLHWWKNSLDTRLYFVIDDLTDSLDNKIIFGNVLEKEKIIEAEKGKIISKEYHGALISYEIEVMNELSGLKRLNAVMISGKKEFETGEIVRYSINKQDLYEVKS